MQNLEELLSVTSVEYDGVWLVTLTGELDRWSSASFNAEMKTVLHHAVRSIVVDVGALSFADVGGIDALVRGAEVARRRGVTFTVVGERRFFRRVVGILGLGSLLAPSEGVAIE